MDWQQQFSAALSYADFLAKYGQPGHVKRWQAMFEQVRLAPPQFELLGSFTREINVLCLAGAWCGDCINQCPIFERFAAVCPSIHLRFLDRDAHPDVQRELMINGGNRVPVVVFLSEDYCEVSRYGERSLSQYRQIARDQLGPSCPTGIVAPVSEYQASITQDWLNEFERMQLILRLSPRLRQRHGD